MKHRRRLKHTHIKFRTCPIPTGIHTIEENTAGFSGHLTEDPGPLGLESKLSPGDWLPLDNVSRVVFLDSISHTKLDVTASGVDSFHARKVRHVGGDFRNAIRKRGSPRCVYDNSADRVTRSNQPKATRKMLEKTNGETRDVGSGEG